MGILYRRSALALALLFATCAALSAAGGTIEGRVVYTGAPKRNPLIRMGADPNCLQINAGKKVVQELVALNADNSIGNVFVHITDDVPYSGPVPSEPVTIVQEGCIYQPRVLGAMVGQRLKLVNSDPTLHNVHTTSDHGNSFNRGQPGKGMEFSFELEGAEVMLNVKCDVHPWMTGFVGVKKHPYFAVTGEQGTFRIEGVPPGSYTLQAWQERLGTVEREIEVEEGSTTSVDLELGPPGG